MDPWRQRSGLSIAPADAVARPSCLERPATAPVVIIGARPSGLASGNFSANHRCGPRCRASDSESTSVRVSQPCGKVPRPVPRAVFPFPPPLTFFSRFAAGSYGNRAASGAAWVHANPACIIAFDASCARRAGLRWGRFPQVRSPASSPVRSRVIPQAVQCLRAVLIDVVTSCPSRRATRCRWCW